MDALKLMEYSRFLRHRYLEAFDKLPWHEFIKFRCASFNSLRDIFLHSVFVLDYWINHLVQGDDRRPEIDYSDFDGMDKVREYAARVESDVDRYLRTVTPAELSRSFQRTLKDGRVIRVTVEDMFIDYFQEETHHRGEFIALLWQMGIEPPHMGWGQFLNR